MPQIVFDPDGDLDTCALPKRRNQRGGGMSPELRCEYVRLMKLITSRDPSLIYTKLRDSILAIMREDVTVYIQTLPEADQSALLADIDQFYSTMEKSDNPFTSINTIGVQISLLFTNYIVHHTKGYNIEENSTYPEFKLYLSSMTEDWKTYSTMKQILENSSIDPDSDSDYSALVKNNNPENTSSPKPIYIVFIGFLSIRELMESFLNDIAYCALNYKTEYIDDGLAIPIIALSHDIGHYDTYTEGCDQSSSYLRELKKFASFANERYDKSILYGIYLILFIFTHENYCKDFETEKNDTKHYSKEFIYKGLFDSMSAFRLLNWFGLAIPKAYRIIQKPGELQEEKIDEYLRKISELYALRYAEFKKSQASSGGRRKRMTRKKRVGRKQKKSRRSVKRH